MSKGMIKTTIREIRESLGRYLAILAIVTLGVSLFIGLKITTPAMIMTGNDYLKEQNFFDFRLLSTIGFTQEDAGKLAQLEEIAEAEGTLSVDALCAIDDGNEAACKVQAIPEKINRLVLLEGRMPQGDDECVLDAALCEENTIGSRITVTENNSEDTLDMFRIRTYTVVGVVHSPCYLNFERGTTSIGEGRISGFVCVPRNAFDCDYVTDIYLTTEKKFDIYTDEYNDYIEAVEDDVEVRTEELVQARYEKLIADAQEEIDDAQRELDEKTAEAEEELDDAWKQIEDAEAELTDGEQELEDGEREILDHEKEIEDGRRSIRQARADLDAQEEELNGQEQELLAMQGMMPTEQYQGALMQIQGGREQISAARAQIAAREEELRSGEKELEKAREELNEGREEIADAKAELLDAKTEYEDAKAEFEEEVADAETKIADARAELADIEEPDRFILDRDSNIGYACFESDASIVEAIAIVFPVFFFLVAALICMTTMNRMVEEQRTQIGVLKALGYGNAAIMGKFLFYAGSAAAVGAVLGCLIGTSLFPQVIWLGYRIMYDMEEINYLFDGWLAFLSLAAALLCSMGTAYLSCRYELISVPANLIRPKAPKSGKRIFLERIGFIWNRMKFLHKVSVRNLIRYKKRFIMMILGISGCTALLVTGFGVRDSVMNIADLQYREIQTFDIGITFADPLQEGETDALAQAAEGMVEKIASRYEESVDMEFGGKMKSLYLVIPETAEGIENFLNLHTKEGEAIPYPAKGEAVVSTKAAENMGIRAGSKIVLRDSDGNTITSTVSALCENYVYNYVYLSKDTYEEQLGTEPEYKSAYVTVAEGADIHGTAAVISDMDNVIAVSVLEDMRDRISSMLKSMDYIVALIIFCAGSLAFIVLYNLTNINIMERMREIATIKVLGFYARETADYVFRENFMLTGMGAFVGLGLGKLLHWFVMYQINIDMISFKTSIAPMSYVLGFVVTFLFAILVSVVMYFKLEKINMAESLKSIE